MGKKDDLIARAKALSIELDSSETISDLEAKIALAESLNGDGGDKGEDTPPGNDEGNDSVPGNDENSDDEETPEGDEGPVMVKRARVNRGSTRRLMRCHASLNAALDAAIKEFDLQVYEADKDGERTGEWEVVKGLRAVREGVNEAINKLIAG